MPFMETEKKLLFSSRLSWNQGFPLHAWTWESGFKALWHHMSSCPFAIWWLSIRTSRAVLIVLMIMCHSDTFHVRHAAELSEGKEKLQADVVLCCSKWLMTLSVVVLWLRLQWFITTAHNVIRLYMYTQQNSVVLLYDPNVCVCVYVCAHTVFLSIYITLHRDDVHLNAFQVSLNRFSGKKKTKPSFCIKAGNVLHVRYLLNDWKCDGCVYLILKLPLSVLTIAKRIYK